VASEGRFAVEFQVTIGLEEVEVGAYLNRAIPSVFHAERDYGASLVVVDRLLGKEKASDRNGLPGGEPCFAGVERAIFHG
jgi:hypothetical protein